MADIGRASSATSTSFVARPRRTASAALSSSSGDAWPSPSPSSCPKRDARRETDRASWAVFACFRHWIRKSAGPEMSETSLIGKKNGASLRSPEQKQASSSHKAGGTLTRSTQSCRLRASKKHSRWSQRGEKHNDQLIDLKRNFQLGYSYDPQQQPQACNWQGKAWQFFPRLFVAQKKMTQPRFVIGFLQKNDACQLVSRGPTSSTASRNSSARAHSRAQADHRKRMAQGWNQGAWWQLLQATWIFAWWKHPFGAHRIP